MRALNTDLTARVKTKAGLSRELKRETGGKQGGKLIVPLFSKMMDDMAEDLMADEKMGIKFGDVEIPCLLFVDDSLSLAEGYAQQEATLEKFDEFAVMHKLEWGQEKCKTMEIGSHKEKRKTWTLGDKQIEKCDEYQYLGEIISRDGKNTKNLRARFDKVKTRVRSIITSCKNHILQNIATKTMIQLHESQTLPALLYNAETWTLTSAERKLIDQMEIYAWKKMIGLPNTTPTAAIIHTTGSLFASIRVDVKQLIFLQRILKKEMSKWGRTTLLRLKEHDYGWAKQINNTLTNWNLETDWHVIQEMSVGEWKRRVDAAAEEQNLCRLKKECLSKNRNETKQKTKTKYLEEVLNDKNYKREPSPLIHQNQKLITTRALIMGRAGMLQCANNFYTKYKTKNCNDCGVIDDESHRINDCTRWRAINLKESHEKIIFDDIYTGDADKCQAVLAKIIGIWDLANGKNEMRKVNCDV